MLRGVFVGHGPPAVEREAWELRVLGAVILQALEDMQRGDDEAEAWLAEAIGLDGDEMRGLARQFVRRRGRVGESDLQIGERGRERVCRHCGESYRGLACPCRKRAARAARAKDPSPAAAASAQDDRAICGSEVRSGESVGSDGAICGSLADGKG